MFDMCSDMCSNMFWHAFCHVFWHDICSDKHPARYTPPSEPVKVQPTLHSIPEHATPQSGRRRTRRRKTPWTLGERTVYSSTMIPENNSGEYFRANPGKTYCLSHPLDRDATLQCSCQHPCCFLDLLESKHRSPFHKNWRLQLLRFDRPWSDARSTCLSGGPCIHHTGIAKHVARPCRLPDIVVQKRDGALWHWGSHMMTTKNI